jgi:hypothetical protein
MSLAGMTLLAVLLVTIAQSMYGDDFYTVSINHTEDRAKKLV